ncbi:MAG: glycosyltransferase family 4 protein [Clostridiaceae bacterium]
MRVLFLTNMPAPYRVDFFNELGKSCDLTVLFESQADKSRNDGWVADKMTGFKAVFMKGIKKGDADAFCPEVIRYLSLKKYDLIVVGAYHTPTGMLAIEYMKLRRIPFIISSDGGMKKKDHGIRHKIKQHFIGAASAWLSTGETTSEYLTYYGANADKIYVYPFTSIKESDIIAEPLSEKERRAYREKLGIQESRMMVAVGQFIHRKGYDILLKSCKDMDPSVGVYIVGGQPTKEYHQMQLDMDLSNVHFVDFMKKKDLAEYYKAADFFVHPTREDIWGLVINEAMAFGLPVITTDKCVAGIEMVENGINGWVVKSESVSELSEAIQNLLACDIRKAACIALQKARAYTIEQMALEHIKILGKLVDRV